MTVRQFIIDALCEIGIMGADEALDASDADISLRRFQGMVDLFQSDRLLLYTVLRTVYALTANQQTRTIGAAGNFVGNRPLWIAHMGVIPVGADYEIEVVPYRDREDWLSEPIKTMTALYPYRYLYEPSSALLGTFTFWPIPTTAASVAISTPVPLATPLVLDTDLTFPPGGYLEAWHLNLARRLQRPFVVPQDPELREDARFALAQIRRLNNDAPPLSRSDPAIVGTGGFDIRSGTYR